MHHAHARLLACIMHACPSCNGHFIFAVHRIGEDTMATLSAVKAQSRAREHEERKYAERRRNVLVLMLRHLADAGYVDSFERLSAEANLSLDRVGGHPVSLRHVMRC